jgi:hypothetical protein
MMSCCKRIWILIKPDMDELLYEKMESNLINVIYRVLLGAFVLDFGVAFLRWERYIGRCRAGEFDGDGTCVYGGGTCARPHA